MNKTKRKYLLISLILGIILPSLVIFILEVFWGHINPSAAVIDIIKSQFGGGHNLFLIMFFGLIPFATLIVVINSFYNKLRRRRLDCIFYGGLAGILIITILGYFTVWYPLYSGGHSSSTDAIAFFFIPFYALFAMGIGMFFGWLISLMTCFEKGSTVTDE